ncbi:PREDICTED: uncharacterized protein LOC109472600 [Branchiostoma belcheri]|uniref:Uncharacterized protein LOC109472600 n=1 Tax=Branchiostoma belcheri TaxID=7741 RepID=A0A6P4Z1Y8_BRABE|nr:PREDICTED: uncharacterized protein LOC109472600 [Branchiostoma belcheri]
MSSSGDSNEAEIVGSTPDVKKTPSFEAAKGVVLTLMSAIAISFSAEFTALISKEGIPSFQIFFLKRSIELLTLVPILAFWRPKLYGENRRQNFMLFLFATVTNVSMVAYFLSFVYTVPGIAFGIIQGLMPFFVACIGFLVLKESLSLVDGFGMVISVSGVVLVAVGNTQVGGLPTKLLVMSIVMPLLASFALAPDVVIMRYLTGTLGVPIVTALLYQDTLGAVACLGITYAAEIPVWTMSWRTVLYVVGLGVSKSLGTFLLLAALKFVKAYISTTVRMFVIPITLLLDYFFMQKIPHSFQVTGMVLVMLGIVFVSGHTWWRKHRQKEYNVSV